ncbi:ATP synthase F1 subunit delta [Synechococcus sp. CS-1328]|uniref:ATP synthase F1 subunit delta n=1 Tax=Synechococcus sp. CS-1328 TaxID=2847976 RepID=UPI00223B9D99|nr:ATP synthase F1 subunit delta [Synechococcus sp. CS-1328]MCT0225725.1 F0F1 ATP synthase subunit delta [Synechococcus sp. CS-1328]
MPLLNSITTPYAEAFLQVAEAHNETDQVVEQARQILALWNESDDLREALTSPVIEIEAKKSALQALFEEQVTPTFLNLLKLLADRQRIEVLDAVLERLLELYRQQNRIALATVTSATQLGAEQLAQITSKIKTVAATEQVEVVQKVDPSLIGGFTVSVGSQVIDASLSGQVRRLGLALVKVS